MVSVSGLSKWFLSQNFLNVFRFALVRPDGEQRLRNEKHGGVGVTLRRELAL